MEKKIFHLNLKKKWFDMILSGEKKEEYREMTSYWRHRFNDMFYTLGKGHPIKIIIKNEHYNPEDVIICFSNGYRKDRRQFKVELLDVVVDVNNTKEEWGAKKDKHYFTLRLGEIVE